MHNERLSHAQLGKIDDHLKLSFSSEDDMPENDLHFPYTSQYRDQLAVVFRHARAPQ